MFDTLLQEVAKKFGVGDKAGWILSALLGLLFNRHNGGMSGFLEQLTRGGLGRVVNSWLGKDEPMEINASQFESAMGSGILDNLVSKIGLDRGPIAMAVSYMLPKVVRALTPNGVVPSSIPAAVAQYIGTNGNEDDQPAPISETPQEPEQQPIEAQHQEPESRQDYSLNADSPDEKSEFNWWWLLLPLLLLLGWCSFNPPQQTDIATTQAPDVIPETEIPPAAMPSMTPTLSIANEADNLTVSGTVADATTKESIFEMLKSEFGPDNVSGDISVDPATASAGWFGKLKDILPALKGASGATLNFDGDNVALGGNLDQGAIDSLMEKLSGIFGVGFNVSSTATPAGDVGAATGMEQAPGEESDNSATALKDMVTSGNASVEDLLEALNAAGINFSTGSFNIMPESMTVLGDAAEAIKAAPASTQIEVGGHTDNTGSSEINLSLSGKRAQAVVDALVGMGVDASMLTANGYGDSQPIADNDTEEGRAKNRRMEFTLQ